MPRNVRRQSLVSCAKTAEPTEMLFGLWTRLGSINRVLDGGQTHPWEGAILGGRACSSMSDDCAQMAELNRGGILVVGRG